MKSNITHSEYQQKRYEIAKDVLASAATAIEIQNGDSKQRSSLIFNCIQMADSLLEELYNRPTFKSASEDETSVHKLSDLLKKPTKD